MNSFLTKVRKLFKGGKYSREETIWGNTVYSLISIYWIVCKIVANYQKIVHLIMASRLAWIDSNFVWIQKYSNIILWIYISGGFYKVEHGPFLMVGLNSNIWYRSNKVNFTDSVDPSGQFKWLEKTLEDAKQNDKKVLINTLVNIYFLLRNLSGP